MILARTAIRRLLRSGNLVVTPLLDEGQQIGRASIDVRLGNEFVLVNKETGVLGIDPLQRTELAQRLIKYQSRVNVPFGARFYLHPGEFCLARTLEYLAFPSDVAGYVVGRSSWGRLGLIIATATMIEPRFKGTLVLELANLGSVPIVLYPVMRIAQLVLHGLEGSIGR